jgi:hypothetical protein
VGLADFVVIGLPSQEEAVREHVKGWSLDAVVSWLSEFGTVEMVAFREPDDYPTTFRFSSASGRHAAFVQQADGSVRIFLVDH